MNEQELAQFVEWLPSNIEEFKDKTPKEIVTTLNKMSQTEEGMNMISILIDQFKQSSQMFKKGGKISSLIDKFQNGGKSNQRSSDINRKDFHGVDLFEYGPNRYKTSKGYLSRNLQNGTKQEVLSNNVGLRQITRDNITTTELVSPDKKDTLYIHNGIGGRVDSNIDDSGVLGLFKLQKSSPTTSRYRELQNKFNAQKFEDGGETSKRVTSKKGNTYTVDKADTTSNGIVIRRLVGDLGNGVFNVMEQYQKVNDPNDLRYNYFNRVNYDYVNKLRKNPKTFSPFELSSKKDNGFRDLFEAGYNLNK